MNKFINSILVGLCLLLASIAVAGPSIFSVYQGGTGLNAVGVHQVLVGTASNVFTAKTVPDCQDTGGNHLNYTQSSDAFSCGITGGTGSGGLGTLFTSSLSAAGGGNAVGSGLTDWMVISGAGAAAASSTTTQEIISFGCTAQNMSLATGSTQSGTGSFVVTLFDNTANAATSLVITVAAGATAGTFSDNVHTPSLITNHFYSYQLKNNASATAASLLGVGFQCN